MNDKMPTERDATIEDQFTIVVNIEGLQCQLRNYNHNNKRYLILLDKMTTKPC